MKTLFVALVALLLSTVARAQVPQYPNEATRYLNGTAGWTIPSLVSNAATVGTFAVGGGFTRSFATLTAASEATNFGIDLATGNAGFIQVANHVAITGLTNNAAGAVFTLLLVNTSGTNFNFTVPATSFGSGVPAIVTNGAAAIVSIYGTGATTNAIYWYTPAIK
jgi:hypothetical protein